MPDPYPCDSLPGRLRQICRGEANGVSRSLRRQYIEAWLADGRLPADPDARRTNDRHAHQDHGEVPPSAPDGRTTYDPATPCRHLGEVIRIEQCKLCGGKSRPAEVRACSLKGECTLNEFKLKLPICFKCREYEP